MVRLGRLQIVLVSILSVALAASVSVNLRQSRRLAAQQQQREADLQSLRELRARPQPNAQQTPAEAGEQVPVGDHQATLARRAATIERLKREMSETHANVSELQEQLLNSNEEHERVLATINERHLKEKEDLQSEVDTLRQELESAQVESQSSRQRASALEADNAKLKSAAGVVSSSARDLGRVVADLRDVDRRREVYLTSITRRYRDITSQFRAMSGMLESSRDPNSSSFSGAALTRIQDAISLADDDLRQLNELNAHASQLEKNLMKK
jgi:hypothetical protein